MTVQRSSRRTALVALAITVGFAGVGAAANSQEQSEATRAPGGMPKALRLAADAVGGVADLRALRSFRYTAKSQRWILDEGVRAGDGSGRSATVDATVRRVFGNKQARDRLRIDAVRNSLGVDRPVHEVLAGRRGYIRGVDANFSSPATKPMTSDRWAAIHAEQALLNPLVLLHRAVLRPHRADDGGTRTVNGRRYRVVVLHDDVAPIRMYINTRTGRLELLRTTQHDYLRRDVPIEVRYRRWAAAGDGLLFPRKAKLTSDGEPMIRERRSAIEANPTIRGRVFRFPSDLGPAPFKRGLARIGERTSQWLTSFANLGFVKDGGQRAINPITITDGTNTAQGLTLLGGVANNSLVVQRSNGVVVFEGALHNHRAEAVIRFIRNSPDFTGPITHVVTTHHHADHAGGQRPYVALGATAVVGRDAAPFFRRSFRDRGATILPDRLDRSDVKAKVLGVSGSGRVLVDAQGQGINVAVYPLQGDHATDMVVPYVVDQGVLFTSDIYSPPRPPSPNDPAARAIAAMVEARGLNPKWIAGGHGTFISYAAFKAALNAP